MRLIDADERIAEVKRSPMDPKLKDCVLDVLRRAPTVSAAPENKPLTLEQLKGMQSEPVWVKSLCNGAILGAVINNDHAAAYVFSGVRYDIFSNYGKTWLAYARKPEGSEP